MGNLASRVDYDSQATFAAKLASQRHCVVAFLSPSCGLCTRLRPTLTRVEVEAGDRLAVARLNTMHDAYWAPEMLRYDVEAVPCLVLLGPDGKAACKTGPPTTAHQMEWQLAQMLHGVQR